MAATSTAPPPEIPELVIEAGRAESQYWRDLWRYRELFYFLAWRDILVRYKQTAIGVAWAVHAPAADHDHPDSDLRTQGRSG